VVEWWVDVSHQAIWKEDKMTIWNATSGSSSSSNSSSNRQQHTHVTMKNKKKQTTTAAFLKGIVLIILGFVVIPVLYLQVWLSGTFVPYHHYYSSSSHHTTNNHYGDGGGSSSSSSNNNNPIHETLREFRQRHASARSAKNTINRRNNKRISSHRQEAIPTTSSPSSSSRKKMTTTATTITKSTNETMMSQKLEKLRISEVDGEKMIIIDKKDQQPSKASRRNDKLPAGTTKTSVTLSKTEEKTIHNKLQHRPVLTAYLESPSTLTIVKTTTKETSRTRRRRQRGDTTTSTSTTLIRNTTASSLIKREYPNVDTVCRYRHHNDGTGEYDDPMIINLPIDDYPVDDPFLPWLHDYFVSTDAKQIQFIGQNRRRCDTGPDHIDDMEYWEPQVSLFQPIPIVVRIDGVDDDNNNENNRTTQRQHSPPTTSYRIASSVEEATSHYPATRFQCRFYNPETQESIITLSTYKFDYEYVSWRKIGIPMFDRKGGSDSAMFWLSTLLFACPVPEQFQSSLLVQQPFSQRNSDRRSTLPPPSSLSSSSSTTIDTLLPDLYLDLIPIRTPARSEFLLTEDHIGPEAYSNLHSFDLAKKYGTNHVLPAVEDAGRWSNLPLCPRRLISSYLNKDKGQTEGKEEEKDEDHKSSVSDLSSPTEYKQTTKPFQFVACTWTSASYTRRGDAVRLSDSADRLREWIIFHLLVGVDHIYIYDNTDPASNNTDLRQVADEFRSSNQVTYHPWPCKVCNNNRPANTNPGERSSQYAAEASCRERYGPLTEWMTFLDADEYLVPMKEKKREQSSTQKVHSESTYSWRPILDEMLAENISIIEFRSSRAKPRRDLME
jgi:Glycosyltransferase family 92